MATHTDKTEDSGLLADLQLARRGTAYFERKLAELGDDDLDGPSLLPGWVRRHVVAHVGYNARALARLAGWAATGAETPMYSSTDARNAEIAHGATLSPAALRDLSAQGAAELDAAWRDLEPDAWNAEVRTAQGRMVPVSETVWMRTREVWLHAVDLNNGGKFGDFADGFIDRLLMDVLGAWRQRREAEGIPHFILRADDRVEGWLAPEAEEGGVELHGTAAALASWATGRETAGVRTADGGPVPSPPRWL